MFCVLFTKSPRGNQHILEGMNVASFGSLSVPPLGELTTTSLLFPSGLLLPFVAPPFTPSGFAPLGQRTAKQSNDEQRAKLLPSVAPKGQSKDNVVVLSMPLRGKACLPFGELLFATFCYVYSSFKGWARRLPTFFKLIVFLGNYNLYFKYYLIKFYD